jgi:CPA2 family monovalent cation:H+ antiporter-2
LLGLLFVSIGARLDLSEVLANPLPTIGVALGLIAIKILIVLPLARAFGLTSRAAQETAFVLAPAGEFALVVLGIAVAERVVPASAAAIATIAATLSMFAVPLLVQLAQSVAARRGANTDYSALAPEPHDGPPRTIIVGHGRVGSMVGGMLARHDIPYVAIDADPALVASQRNKGHKVYYGDATRPELLRRCGIANALALVVTMDEPKAVEAVVVAGRAEREDLVIVARARDAAHAAKLYGLKATDAVPETIEASLQLAEAVLIDVGIPTGQVIASIHERRDELRHELQGSASAAIKRDVGKAQDV